jgi:hypothetical protein
MVLKVDFQSGPICFAVPWIPCSACVWSVVYSMILKTWVDVRYITIVRYEQDTLEKYSHSSTKRMRTQTTLQIQSQCLDTVREV